MTRYEMLMRDFNVRYEILVVRYMIDGLTKGVQDTPITKGVFGYKCKNQDIVEREKNLLENLEGIQKHLHTLCEMTEEFGFECVEEG